MDTPIFREKNTFIALIPAYNPGRGVISIITEVSKYVDLVVVINDGSNYENKRYINEIGHLTNVKIKEFEKNKGKGYALLAGLKESLKHRPDYIITIDSDGQHEPCEIPNFQRLVSKPGKHHDLVLGARSDLKTMPLRSKIGNIFTARLFLMIFDKSLVDTQSGFRMLSRNFARRFIDKALPGRYETEMQMLVFAAESKISIDTINIPTRYFDDNKNSSFQPLRDSLLVLSVFLKYVSVILTSFILDYGIFLMLIYVFGKYYIVSHLIARLLRGIFSFIANKCINFKDQATSFQAIIRHLMATILSLTITTMLLYGLVEFMEVSRIVAKPVAELILFFIGFFFLNHLVIKWWNKST